MTQRSEVKRPKGDEAVEEQAVTSPAAASDSRQLLVLSNPNPQGRGKLFYILSALLGALSLVGISSRVLPGNYDPLDFEARTNHILSTTPLIDGHNDLPWLLRIELQNKIYNDRFTFRQGLLSHTDLQKIRKGKLGGQFWSIYNECDLDHNGLNDPSLVVRDTLETIDVARRFIDEFSDIFEYCDTPSCVSKAFAKGKVASMMGLEGLHLTGNSLGAVRLYYELGIRYMTLTHNCDNAYAQSAWNSSENTVDHGLTEFGVKAIHEFNRLGIMVDLSHTSPQTMRDAISVSKAPIIFSHTLATGVANHWRNTPDDVVRLTGKTGGILMVTFINRFLTLRDPKTASVDDVVDHIIYIANLAGWDHVGIGSDFDGTPVTPKDLEDVSKYPNIFIKLLERGVTDEQLRKLAGENILRVWAEVEEVSKSLRHEKPVEDYFDGRIFSKVMRTPYMFPDSVQTRNWGTDKNGEIVYDLDITLKDSLH